MMDRRRHDILYAPISCRILWHHGLSDFMTVGLAPLVDNLHFLTTCLTSKIISWWYPISIHVCVAASTKHSLISGAIPWFVQAFPRPSGSLLGVILIRFVGSNIQCSGVSSDYAVWLDVLSFTTDWRLKRSTVNNADVLWLVSGTAWSWMAGHIRLANHICRW